MSNNLQHKDLIETLKNLGVNELKKSTVSDSEVKKDWNKLAGALRGL